MKDYFLEIWKGDKPDNILKFTTLENAWHYVIENKIERFCVYKGECIIDNTSYLVG